MVVPTSEASGFSDELTVPWSFDRRATRSPVCCRLSAVRVSSRPAVSSVSSRLVRPDIRSRSDATVWLKAVRLSSLSRPLRLRSASSPVTAIRLNASLIDVELGGPSAITG